MDKSTEKIDINKLINKDIVVFGEDLNRHAHSLEHLIKYSFSENRFIWVETIGLRSPNISIYDLKRIFNKMRSWVKKKEHQEKNIYPNVTILSPIMIPYNQFRIIRLFNRWSVKKNLKNELLKQEFKNIITITSVPQASEYINLYPSSLKIYYCVDDFSLWPGINHKLAKNLEQSLIEEVDIVLATSDELSRTKLKKGKKTITIPHGVDFEHFDLGTKDISETIKICYFGLIDERMDTNIITNIAKSLPYVEIILIGDIVIDKKLFKNFDNIKLISKISYQDLPQLLTQIDIFLLPYKMNKLTKNINPLKIREYLATSRVVISTPLPEVIKLKDYLYIAECSEGFVDILKKYKNQSLKYNYKKTRNFIKENEAWHSRNKDLCALINASTT